MEYLHENKNKFLNMINLTSERLHMLPFIVKKISIKKLLDEIVNQNIYKDDYEKITARILWEDILYKKAITSIKNISESEIFD